MSDPNDHAETIKKAAQALFALDSVRVPAVREEHPTYVVARDAVVRHVAEALGVAATAPAPDDGALEQRVRRIVAHLQSQLRDSDRGSFQVGHDMASEYAIKLLTQALDGKEPTL